MLLLIGTVTLVIGAMEAREARQRRRAAKNLQQIGTATEAYHVRQPKP
jgi:hypothetical protein